MISRRMLWGLILVHQILFMSMSYRHLQHEPDQHGDYDAFDRAFQVCLKRFGRGLEPMSRCDRMARSYFGDRWDSMDAQTEKP